MHYLENVDWSYWPEFCMFFTGCFRPKWDERRAWNKRQNGEITLYNQIGFQSNEHMNMKHLLLKTWQRHSTLAYIMFKWTVLTYLNGLCSCLGASGSARSFGSSWTKGKTRFFRAFRGKGVKGQPGQKLVAQYFIDVSFNLVISYCMFYD